MHAHFGGLEIYICVYSELHAEHVREGFLSDSGEQQALCISLMNLFC